MAGLGTGGTLMGAGERLREAFPASSSRRPSRSRATWCYGLRSLEDGYTPPILDVARLDRKILVTTEESIAAARLLLDEEGIFAGVSSGAVLHVARRIGAELDDGVVVCVLADGGWKYLSRRSGTPGATRRTRASGGDRRRGALGARRARRGGASQRGLRAASRSGTASRSATSRGATPSPSPYRFELEVDPETWFLEDEGYELAVFHSHLASPARPSRTESRTSASGRGGRT